MKQEWLDSLKKYYRNEQEKLKRISGEDCYSV